MLCIRTTCPSRLSKPCTAAITDWPEPVLRAYEMGCEVASHSYAHRNLGKMIGIAIQLVRLRKLAVVVGHQLCNGHQLVAAARGSWRRRAAGACMSSVWTAAATRRSWHTVPRRRAGRWPAAPPPPGRRFPPGTPPRKAPAEYPPKKYLQTPVLRSAGGGGPRCGVKTGSTF